MLFQLLLQYLKKEEEKKYSYVDWLSMNVDDFSFC